MFRSSLPLNIRLKESYDLLVDFLEAAFDPAGVVLLISSPFVTRLMAFPQQILPKAREKSS